MPLIEKIKAERVFVDLPIHLKDTRGMKPETLNFLRTVIAKRDERTKYMKKLTPLASKIIPVISTYHNRTGERNSITLQANDLRPHFETIAFRTFQDSFNRDILQIEAVLRETDYIIMDWDSLELDSEDCDQQDIIEKLETLNCTVIIHRNPIPKEITNIGLVHNTVIDNIDNTHIERYKDFSGSGFSDYSGIKKDNISSGGTISPGFIYYDAVENKFYGYKGTKKELIEFELTIVPAIISSSATQRMRLDALDYLGPGNEGWTLIQNIRKKIDSGKSPAKFKRIGLEHYLHCLRTRIANGDFS